MERTGRASTVPTHETVEDHVPLRGCASHPTTHEEPPNERESHTQNREQGREREGEKETKWERDRKKAYCHHRRPNRQQTLKSLPSSIYVVALCAKELSAEHEKRTPPPPEASRFHTVAARDLSGHRCNCRQNHHSRLPLLGARLSEPLFSPLYLCKGRTKRFCQFSYLTRALKLWSRRAIVELPCCTFPLSRP